MKDIVYSEAEYAILAKRIQRYSTILSSNIIKYQGVLDFLMEKAIKDEKIQAQILKLKSDISLYVDQLESVRSDTNTLLLKLSEEFEKADKITLPDIGLSNIQSVLNVFR